MHSWIRQRRDHFWRLVVPTAMTIALTTSTAVQAATETAIFAGGCYWCVESDFDQVPGVLETISGFTGGETKDPTYKQVTSGNTGHLEAVQITFDPGVVTYRELVDTFWRSIDPTDSGGQFCDRGHSYTTAVFVMDEQQKMAATESKRSAIRSLGSRIVTPVREASTFYPADEKHQDYYLGTNRVLTRFGVIKQSDAYKRYRKACGRDERVRELWGDQAIFAGDH